MTKIQVQINPSHPINWEPRLSVNYNLRRRHDSLDAGARTHWLAILIRARTHQSRQNVLVVGIADPRESAQGADYNRNVGNDAHDENRVVVDIEVAEIIHDFEQQPKHSGERAAAVNAAKMLECETR